MTTEERLRAAIGRLEKLKAESTAGEWVYGDRWGVGGVDSGMYGDGKCAYCERMGEPTWIGKRPINGKRMQAHVHESSEPLWEHGIFASHGSGPICVINDTLEYGYMDDADANLIVTLHRTIDAQLEFLRAALMDTSRLVSGTATTTLGVPSYMAIAVALANAILGED